MEKDSVTFDIEQPFKIEEPIICSTQNDYYYGIISPQVKKVLKQAEKRRLRRLKKYK